VGLGQDFLALAIHQGIAGAGLDAPGLAACFHDLGTPVALAGVTGDLLGHAEGAGIDTVSTTTASADVQAGQPILLEEGSTWANGNTGGIKTMIAAVVLVKTLQIGKRTPCLFGDVDVLDTWRQFISGLAGSNACLTANATPDIQ
jgi:hypothetical protein